MEKIFLYFNCISMIIFIKICRSILEINLYLQFKNNNTEYIQMSTTEQSEYLNNVELYCCVWDKKLIIKRILILLHIINYIWISFTEIILISIKWHRYFLLEL